jgi:hypothetical protein
VIWTWSSVAGGCCGCCPAHYRDNWEQDMVAALLERSPTDDPEEEEYIIEFGEPKWPVVAGVAGLAARLYLGGAGAPRRYFAPAAANYDAPGTPKPEGRRTPASRHAREGAGAVWAVPVFG